MNGGYVKSYRSKWDHPIFRNKQEAAVWAWMCDTAQWQDARLSTKFGPIELKRGELLIAERVIAEDFGLHRNTLRDLLNRMTKDGMINAIQGRCPQRAGTVIVVTKYGEYQGRFDAEIRTANGTANCTANGTASRTANDIDITEQNQGDIDDFLNAQDRKRDRKKDQKRTANGTKNNEDKEPKKIEREGSEAKASGAVAPTSDGLTLVAVDGETPEQDPKKAFFQLSASLDPSAKFRTASATLGQLYGGDYEAAMDALLRCDGTDDKFIFLQKLISEKRKGNTTPQWKQKPPKGFTGTWNGIRYDRGCPNSSAAI